MSETRLTRSTQDSVIAGVAGGIATYLKIDPVLVRVAFLILLFASGIGFPLYIILWIVMPLGDGSSNTDTEAIKMNIGEMGESVSSGLNRLGRPGTIGVILILLGAYFLLTQLGIVQWIGGALFWPLVIIGFGVYLLLRRSK
ncbi:MAG: PspC domain-containing protein [Candidatus Promineifilaceae bacterium]|nr:PspC domain-containing protein [Candidatus Promineifilaceae bacterium]